MKKKFVWIIVFALLLGTLTACGEESTKENESESASLTESSSESDVESASSEETADASSEVVSTEDETTEATTEATTDAATEATTQAYVDPYNGVLTDRKIFSDVASLSNKSIPYGNDWDDKDSTGMPNGVHWYEAVYGQYQGVYRIKTEEKLLYLTFDEGYEAGYTPQILDTLKANNVKAVFFITKQFFDSDPELVQRMIDEGHVVGNHTCLHPSGGFPNYVAINGIDTFINDISKLHKLVYDRFGYTMTLFRFPEGESSEMLLAEAYNLGYTCVFWSYAHYDYNRSNQPEVSVTLNRCLTHMAPGAIYLLHACSSSNTEALDDFIKGARSQGYEFASFPVDSFAH